MEAGRMTIVGRATAMHKVTDPRDLKYIHAVAKRDKYKRDIETLAKSWAKAIKNGESGRYRVFLEVGYSAALYAYDYGKKLRVCSVDMMYTPELVIKLRKGL